MESNKYKQNSMLLSFLRDAVDSCFTGGTFECMNIYCILYIMTFYSHLGHVNLQTKTCDQR